MHGSHLSFFTCIFEHLTQEKVNRNICLTDYITGLEPSVSIFDHSTTKAIGLIMGYQIDTRGDNQNSIQ